MSLYLAYTHIQKLMSHGAPHHIRSYGKSDDLKPSIFFPRIPVNVRSYCSSSDIPPRDALKTLKLRSLVLWMQKWKAGPAGSGLQSPVSVLSLDGNLYTGSLYHTSIYQDVTLLSMSFSRVSKPGVPSTQVMDSISSVTQPHRFTAGSPGEKKAFKSWWLGTNPKVST